MRMRRPGPALIALLLLAPAPAGAQRVLHQARDDLRHTATDIFRTWTSPARASTHDLEALALTGAAGALLLVVDDDVDRWLGRHPHSVTVRALEPFSSGRDSFVRLGQASLLLEAASLAWIGGLAANSPTLREAASGCAAAELAQTVARHVLVYQLVARTRPEFTADPLEFDVPGSSEWSKRSFVGGHAANAITCAAFLGERYHLGVLEPVLYAAAIGVGGGRMLDRAHWTSDTFLGLVLGYSIGKGVAARSRARAAAHPDAPAEAHDNGLQLGWLGDAIYVGVTRRF